MEIRGKYIVVKVVEGGGGLISESFSEAYAIQHLLQWRDNLIESNIKGWVRVFDVDGMEYSVEPGNRSLLACRFGKN